MAGLRTVDQLELGGKRVFVRVDFNVPLEPAGGRAAAPGKAPALAVADDTRIREALPTLRHVLERRGRLVVASHLGRPGGRRDPAQSLAPVAARLGELLGQPVPCLPDCIGPEVEARVAALRPGEAVLLENLRFHPGEEANDPAFAAALARLADVYVNDAFGTAHRAHASTAGMAPLVPARAAGFLMKTELDYLGRLLTGPARPFVAVLGGAKVSDKLGVLERLVERVDALLVGGAMAYTFLKAEGIPVGRSPVEDDRLAAARQLLAVARARGVRLLLPEDHVVAERPDAPETARVTDGAAIPDGWLGVDIGPRTVERFAREIRQAGTVVWNGPMGIFEIPRFAQGTVALARAVAEATAAGATTVVGGGDSVAAVRQAGVADRISHVSTGGGASLEFLEGKRLPGVAALEADPAPGGAAAGRGEA
ncbi:MAG TPA: phosphoglycerate kinase [Thermodesulfobacteriota bacterium]|nr:phosphoglycerate kinase [Thermodesulfobacteriota bacterium]